MHCPRSVALSERFPEDESLYAAEGTEAHALCEYLLLRSLGHAAEDPRPGMRFYSPAMQEAAEEYVSYLQSRMEAFRTDGSKPQLLVEQMLNLVPWIPEGRGTSDAIVRAGDTLLVCDFKYGMLSVPAESPQLRIYALGAVHLFSGVMTPSRVETVIYQPRLGRVAAAYWTVEELTEWARDELKPAALRAWRDEGDFCPGDWCRFCRARGACRARAEEQLRLAQQEFGPPDTLTLPELSDILNRLQTFLPWAEDVRAYATSVALKGENVPGWVLSEGASRRRFTDDAAVAERVKALGKDPWERRLLSPSALERLLGKKVFREELSGLIERPPGKPVLVPLQEGDEPPAA